VTNRRPKNSERKLKKLEEEEAEREDQPGILELFLRQEGERNEDAPSPETTASSSTGPVRPGR
jgi:hypothetical protein